MAFYFNIKVFHQILRSIRLFTNHPNHTKILSISRIFVIIF